MARMNIAFVGEHFKVYKVSKAQSDAWYTATLTDTVRPNPFTYDTNSFSCNLIVADANYKITRVDFAIGYEEGATDYDDFCNGEYPHLSFDGLTESTFYADFNTQIGNRVGTAFQVYVSPQDLDFYYTVTVTTESTSVTPTPDPTPVQHTITFNEYVGAYNCTPDKEISNTSYKVDDGADFVVTFTANDGYYFDSGTEYLMDGYPDIAISSDTFTLACTWSNVTENLNIQYGDISASEYTPPTPPDPPTPTVTEGFTRAFIPDQSNIDAIVSGIWSPSSSYVDMTQYIVAFRKFFCPLTYDETPVTLEIFGYKWDSEQTYKISETVQRIECGSITIPEKYNSLLDYAPYTEARIFLPFIGFEDVSLQNIMNRTIKLVYVVDVYSGRCLAELYADVVTPETLIYQFAGTIAYDVPITIDGGYYDGTYELMTTLQLGTKIPFVLIQSSIPLEDTTQPPIDGLPSEETKKVSDCHGYVQFKFILAHGMTATEAEKQQIEHLLTTGVLVD